MTRDDLRSVFQNPDGIAARVNSAELDGFLATIGLSSEGLLSARQKILDFLQIPMERDDPAFALVSQIQIENCPPISLGERLVVSAQQCSRTTTSVTQYANAPATVSQQTNTWDDIWARWLFCGDTSEHNFQWGASRCRPGHHLIKLYRGDDRGAMVNVTTRQSWVDEGKVDGTTRWFAVAVGLLGLAFSFWAANANRAGGNVFMVITGLVASLSVAWWMISRDRYGIEYDMHRACARLLGGDAPTRETAWGAALMAILFAAMFILAGFAGSESATTKPAVWKPAPRQMNHGATSVPKMGRKNPTGQEDAADMALTAREKGRLASEGETTRKAYSAVKAICTVPTDRSKRIACAESYLTRLNDPQVKMEQFSPSERKDKIKGVSLFLADITQ